MSAERGTTLEVKQDIAQKVARTIPKIAERRREAVRDLHSWEDAVNSTGRDARLSTSQNILTGFLHTTESQIDSEKEKLIKLALENKRRTQSFLSYSDLYNQGILDPEVFAQKRSDFRAYRKTIINFEVHQGEILLAEERKKQKKAQNKHRNYQRERTVYFAGQTETEPAVFFVNKGLKAIAFNGHEVRFEEGIEWQTILLLAAVNTSARFRKDGQYYSAADIKKYFAERGVNVNAAGVIANILLAVGPDNSDVIERVGKTKGTKYRLNGKAYFFSGPERAFVPKGVLLDSAGRPKIVSIRSLLPDSEQARLTTLRVKDPDYDEHVRKAVEMVSVLHLPKDGNIKPVQSATVLDVQLTFIRRLIETGFIKPERADDHHPGLTRDDLMAIEFASKFKQGLDDNDREELSRSFSEEISRRQKDSGQSV